MPANKDIQYTIRGIPPDVDRSLRARARRKGISLNRLLVDELSAAGGVGMETKHRSLKALGGKWLEDEEFDRILSQQRKIDSELWK